MIIQCEGCAAKYFLADAKVPQKPTRVRCPHCRAVFTLKPAAENVAAGAADNVLSSAAPSPAPAPARAPSPPPKAPPPAPEPPPAAPQPEPPVAASEPLMDLEPAAAPRAKPAGPKEDRDNARARRLARVLVSDILCYNQEKRDQALADGTLMTVLGDEIKKSWELYKEKVGAKLAKSTNYFKEALNEILADGQNIF